MSNIARRIAEEIFPPDPQAIATEAKMIAARKLLKQIGQSLRQHKGKE